MKTMRLSDGDLALGVTSDYETVTGPAKVAQDLRCALLEPLGNDRFHPGWGSTLADYVGQPSSIDIQTQVQGEVNRVVGNYAAVQRDKIEADMYGDGETRYSTREVVASITGISTQATHDSLKVTIGVSTVHGDLVAINEVL